jgi:multidrug efflux pump subunit AcrB
MRVPAGAFRGNRVEDLRQLQVRNAQGQMVRLGTLVAVRDAEAPEVIERLDGEPMVEVTASPAVDVPVAQARTACEGLAEEVRKKMGLPAEYRLTWLHEAAAPR